MRPPPVRGARSSSTAGTSGQLSSASTPALFDSPSRVAPARTITFAVSASPMPPAALIPSRPSRAATRCAARNGYGGRSGSPTSAAPRPRQRGEGPDQEAVHRDGAVQIENQARIWHSSTVPQSGDLVRWRRVTTVQQDDPSLIEGVRRWVNAARPTTPGSVCRGRCVSIEAGKPRSFVVAGASTTIALSP